MAPRAATVRMFAPELWGQVDIFANLHAETYKFDERHKRALAGVSQHFEKALMFQSLAVSLRPKLDIERAELDDRGYSPVIHSRQIGMVVEAALLELYSSVDCTAKVLHAVYGQASRGYKDSTRSLFKGFKTITGAFPEAVKEYLCGVTWYEDLRFLRDELTHLGTGSCHLDDATSLVWYRHAGLRPGGKPLVVDDVFSWLASYAQNVNGFLGVVFHVLNGTLKDTPITQFCGLVEGRMLMRRVNPTEKITFASGECMSYIWFEQPDGPTCPFVTACGAYANTRPEMDPSTLLPSSSES